ncbi:MAG: hypothetical protein K2Q03_05765 [Sphingobacteriaceae bacterium]|nr:hypothetical protein [Sphingobacteriaceae bacterium]
MGVKTQVWTGEVVKQLTSLDNGTFLQDIKDYSNYAKNDVIHLVDIGAEPNVLVNNTTYPIQTTTLADGDITISLDKLETENTGVSNDELYAISYDKIAVVKDLHATALAKKKFMKAIHALAPQQDGSLTPVVFTGGADGGDGYKQIRIKDILNLKRKFDDLEVPEEGRVLVLSSEHLNTLLELDQRFAAQYYDVQSGKLNTMFYGFKIYSYVGTPHFSTTGAIAKKSFGSIPVATDRKASVAFYAPYMFKATGSTDMFYKDKATNTEHRRSEVGFSHRMIVLPKKQAYIGAIVSAKV